MEKRGTNEYDIIKIVGLTATGHHGVYSFERRDGQPFSVDVIMYVDTRGAASGDDLELTVDYSEVATDVNAVLAGPPVFLLETLAQNIAEVVLAYEPVQIVEVVLHKPNAPINYEFSDVTMTIRRSRDEVTPRRRPRLEARHRAQVDVSEPSMPKAERQPEAQELSDTAMDGTHLPAFTRTRSARHARVVPAEQSDTEQPVMKQLTAEQSATAVASETRTYRGADLVKNEARTESGASEVERESTDVAKRDAQSSSPVHEAMWRHVQRETERKEWIAKHQEELAAAVANPAATPIARSMSGWRTGDPRPEPPRFKRPVTSPESPLHAVLAKSYVSRDDLEETPSEPVSAIIALGANMGKPWRTLAEAVVTLDAMPDTSVTGVSALFRTGALLAPGQAPQDDYYNAVVEVRTKLSAIDLLNGTQMIENAFGRVRTEHWGPRTLDLDIITYSTLRSDDPQLTLPHPRAHERAFVLVPWLQLDPNAHVGRFGRADVLLSDLKDQSIEEVAATWVEDAISGNDEHFAATPEVAPAAISNASKQASEVVNPSNFGLRKREGDVARRSIRSRLEAREEQPKASSPVRREPGASSADRVSRERKHSHKKRPRWVPIPRVTDGVHAEAQNGEQSSNAGVVEADRAPETTSGMPLPNWRKRQPRIVDDAAELHRDGSNERPHARVEPGLADDFATGLLPVTDGLKRPSRRTIVRPTVTGTIPIIRPNDEDDTP